MSVVIKGMKMPKRCGSCPLFHAEWPMYCKAFKADKNKEIKAPYGQPRPEWCPLIELPEKHGRLIDADACIEYIQNNDQHAWEVLAYAPTVIEAEE